MAIRYLKANLGATTPQGAPYITPGQIAVAEDHEAHPGGRVLIVDDVIAQAEETPNVLRALGASMLIAATEAEYTAYQAKRAAAEAARLANLPNALADQARSLGIQPSGQQVNQAMAAMQAEIERLTAQLAAATGDPDPGGDDTLTGDPDPGGDDTLTGDPGLIPISVDAGAATTKRNPR